MGLKARGHTIGILTSRHEINKTPLGEVDIWRVLNLEGDLLYYQPLHFFTRWRLEHQENSANLKRIIQAFEPDILFTWGMWAMSQDLPALAESLLPSRVVYYISDYWPSSKNIHKQFWDRAARQKFMRPPKRILGVIAQSLLNNNKRPALKFEHVICVSNAVRDILVKAELPLHQATIIHGGTDLERFENTRKRDFSARPLRLLYAGQLVSHKGVHTAIEAMGKLADSWDSKQATLTIVGSGHPEYESYLRSLVDREHLHDIITFHRPVTREEMPSLMQNFDVLVFPSTYEEPFARIIQEAMLAGLVVVGTTTGGSKEIMFEDINGLTFAPEDASALTRQIRRLLADPALCLRLSLTGQQNTLGKFTLQRMIVEIEAYLIQVIESSIGNEIQVVGVPL